MQNKNIFRLFISSTFNDFKREREVLQSRVFPNIKKYAAKLGCKFQPIDLRWGVSNEAQLDQKTLELCLSEVRICKSYPHPNFLVMLGDRYGWVPLPYAIEKKEFDSIVKVITNDYITITYDKYKVKNTDTKRIEEKQKEQRTTTRLELLHSWYSLDKNQLPASYIINERKSDSDYSIYENWEAEESQLRIILQEAVVLSSLSQIERAKYFTSATEAEVREGIITYIKNEYQKADTLDHKNHNIIDAEHVFGLFRNIVKKTQIKDKYIQDDYDRAQAFKNRVNDVLPKENMLHVETKQLTKDSLDEAYLLEFESRMIKFLKHQIDLQIKSDNLKLSQREKNAQLFFSEQKRKEFLETKSIRVLLDKIKTYRMTKTAVEPLIIYGPSGSGKSSIIAQAIKQAESQKKQKVIYRFVGATANSSSSRNILNSIFDELANDARSFTEKDKIVKLYDEEKDKIGKLYDEEKDKIEKMFEVDKSIEQVSYELEPILFAVK